MIDRHHAIMSLKDKTNFGEHKKVRWAFNLEQIVYFYPDLKRQESESKTYKHVIKTLKIKAQDRDFLDWIQKKGEQFMEKLIPGRYGEVNCEDLLKNLINEQWNEWYKLHGKNKHVGCQDSFAKL